MFTNIKLEHYIEYYFMYGDQEHYEECTENVSIKKADKIIYQDKGSFSGYNLVCPYVREIIPYNTDIKFCPYCGEKLK